jgi:hypothetical protein
MLEKMELDEWSHVVQSGTGMVQKSDQEGFQMVPKRAKDLQKRTLTYKYELSTDLSSSWAAFWSNIGLDVQPGVLS